MDVCNSDDAVSSIAAAIGEPARARMLYSLIDGRARTSTELAVIAGVTPSTASVHLERLKASRLVRMLAQGKHRYYSLDGADVAAALEALSVLAGGSREEFVPNTPHRLRAARTCYDHIAGTLGVALHDRFKALGWIRGADPLVRGRSPDRLSFPVVRRDQGIARGPGAPPPTDDYRLTAAGSKALIDLGVDVQATRRRFAYACVDWSERRPHIGGSLGAAVLNLALKRNWVIRDLDSRALSVTRLGRREMLACFGLQLPAR